MGEWRYISVILNLGTRWIRVVSFKPLSLYTPRGYSQTGWAPELFLKLFRREKSLFATGN
jgi:hypothetical protein